MTTKELEKKVIITWAGYGSARVVIKFKGEVYSTYSHNTLAIDRIKCDDHQKTPEVIGFYTYKQALQCLYDEVKRANNLDYIEK